MKDIDYLYAAYAATWIIHITYLWIIARRYKRLQHKIQQLKKAA
jgi:CcmD family protein